MSWPGARRPGTVEASASRVRVRDFRQRDKEQASSPLTSRDDGARLDLCMGRKAVSVSSFLATLQSFEAEPITRDRILHYCLETSVDRSSLSPYVHFRSDMYTRNLIYRDDLLEVMAVCWSPGQRTVIHTHNGQLGWMSVEQGALAVVNYKWLGCNAADNQNVSGLDCLAGATELDLCTAGTYRSATRMAPLTPWTRRRRSTRSCCRARRPGSPCTSIAGRSTRASLSISRTNAATAASSRSTASTARS